MSMAQASTTRALVVHTEDRFGRLQNAPPSWILFYDEHDEVSRIRLHGQTPVAVFVDGACRENGKPWARGAFGVYFGTGSPYNWNGCLPECPDGERHTSNDAEIIAALRALQIIADDLGEKVCRDGVVIITDSAYVYNSITRDINTWVNNGFKDANGRPLVHDCCFATMHNRICELEKKGIRILFWKVDRAHVHEADRLANHALDYQCRLWERHMYRGATSDNNPVRHQWYLMA